MPEVKSYQPGMFCWTDLSTTDVAAAKGFYGDLFGWTYEDMQTPMGPYGMAYLGGKDVAAVNALSADQAKQGVPPHWNLYFSVKNLDESAKRATSLGGKLLLPPMDATEAGRMAVVSDPSGASFCLWQAKSHPGAKLVNEPGAINWAELECRNVEGCKAFYSELFGWRHDTQDMGGMPYTVFKAGEEQRAGMMPMAKGSPADRPSHWTVYFTAASCDATAKKAQGAGAKIVVPTTDIPQVGRFAMCEDPQGAFFAFLQPARR